jgi:ketosteroid isomerase-like protein
MLTTMIIAAALQAAAPEAPALRAEINAANTKWVDAVRRPDPALLRETMAPDYLLILQEGKKVDLPTWTSRFLRMKMNDYGSIITSLRLVGPDIAEANVSAYWDSTLAGGKTVRETFIARDTWMRRGERWVVVRREVVDLRLLD